MRTTLLLTFLLFSVISLMHGQDDAMFLRDSIYCDQGVSGTTNFEPLTRIYFPAYDEQGRVLEQYQEKLDNGFWTPQRRKNFAYEGNQVSMMRIQVWNMAMDDWQDQRKDLFTYENDLLKEHLRQKAPQGQLVNERRWSYEYNPEGEETLVLLEQWNGSAWESLSRKIVTHNQNGDLESQTLQVWMGGAWRNVRSRIWQYEQAGNQSRVKATLVRVWSVNGDEWEDKSRKLFLYNNNGLWVRSRFEDWKADTQEWVNTDRMTYNYNEQNQPTGQYLERWDGAWENRGQVNYLFKDNQFLSRIETWDKANEEWTNFLRYSVEMDNRMLIKTRTGMQAWNQDDMIWENRIFTRQYTHFWSEQIVNNLNEIQDISACVVPNPYPVGTHFFCDLPSAKAKLQLELYDVLGRPVYRRDVQNGDAIAIDSRPTPGVYILRIRDQNQLHHLQRLVIH